ncbi:MazG nucleotide pyrophosphohydrolase [Psychroflexus gondwanensis ACAM 44]|jgi:NTP pyrophosphatase (non-canonical NTP hydrolase)|uniref:MazG nucleotide pyrophosphohydrolase n=1 Tax=Psychroflexus gondwanensis ACAM 44 TaxID=1189619 RepID=N1WQG6_9FLAO|nr:nucleotide pyrophosphohydrolase [Psychroflexus gondwanensis]EMY82516.1 MazG nucleotide pyrophosphohydrolase [Psychroflexus gondwanensis ACAM 44]
MISIHFPRNDKEASAYNGFLDREGNFNKLFLAEEFGSVLNLESGINQFLNENAYKSVSFGSIDETIILENDVLSLSRVEIKASVLLVIYRGINSSLNPIIEALEVFREERDWKQFHNPKDLSMALSIEASELLECFLWKDISTTNKDQINEEVADVFSYLLYIATDLGIDLESVTLEKIKINSKKYPISKSKGVNTKYNKL